LPAKKRLSVRRKKAKREAAEKAQREIDAAAARERERFWQKSAQNVSVLKLSSGPNANSESS
jgi:hypothetical protein